MTPASPLHPLARLVARLVVTGCACIVLALPALAQQQSGADTTKKDATGTKVEQQERRQRRGFVDADGDGINDRSRRAQGAQGEQGEQGTAPRRRGRDTFIDSDGDGINDARSSGSGTGLGTGLRRGGAGRRGR